MTALEGIIVRTYPSSEADLVLKVISPSEGKVSLLAKHARKSAKRFAGGLDLFDRGIFQIGRNRGSLTILTAFSAAKSFRGLREDLDKLTVSSLICECFDLLVQDDATGAAAIYEALKKGLDGLVQAADAKEALRCCHATLLRLLVLTGFLADSGDEIPTARNLLELIARVETCAERKLACRGAMNDLLAILQRREHG